MRKRADFQAASLGMDREIDMHGIEEKFDLAVIGAAKDYRVLRITNRRH